jgi:predicted acetyltransferase
MKHRIATADDCALLAQLNHLLIQDERHSNPMTVAELETRMRERLSDEFRAVLFEQEGEPIAYALFREEELSLHLRQFFVARNRRRKGIGRQAITILRDEIWPLDKGVTVEALMVNEEGLAFWRTAGIQDYYIGLELLPRR